MSQIHHAVLHALFTLAQGDVHATMLRVASRLGVARQEVERALFDLAQAGLVDADRVRLTMEGLTLASVMGPARSVRPAVRRAA